MLPLIRRNFQIQLENILPCLHSMPQYVRNSSIIRNRTPSNRKDLSNLLLKNMNLSLNQIGLENIPFLIFFSQYSKRNGSYTYGLKVAGKPFLQGRLERNIPWYFSPLPCILVPTGLRTGTEGWGFNRCYDQICQSSVFCQSLERTGAWIYLSIVLFCFLGHELKLQILFFIL